MFWYEVIKEYYNLNLYSDIDLEVFVKAKWITGDQYKKITGVDFEQ